MQVTLNRILSEELDRALRDQAVEVNNTVRVELLLPLPDPDAFASGGTYIQIADLEGRVAGGSANLGEQMLPIDRAALATARGGRAVYDTVQVGQEPLRLFTAPLYAGERIVDVVQVARSLSPALHAVQQLRSLLWRAVRPAW